MSLTPESLSPHSTRFLDVNGLKYAFIEAGAGTPVIFLHGFPDLACTWNDTISGLSDNYRCIAPYMRGYYPTDIATDENYSVKIIAEDILALCDQLGIDTFYLVGHDWGASIAYTLANLAPKRVKKLVTVAIPIASVIKPTLKLIWRARHFLFFSQ